MIAEDASNADKEQKPAPAKPGAIVPERSVAGNTLMSLIAIMTFLSCVTLGVVVLVQKSAIAWSSEVGREVTIQIRPVAGEVMQSNLRTAVSLAKATPGVTGARALTLAESQALLEPWLGDGLDLSALAVPRLVIVELAAANAADLAQLERNLEAINGASLNTHVAWRQRLNIMASTVVVSGLLVLGLILTATVLAIIFATRGTMASNRTIVDVLHFIGASNNFIAEEFQGRFLRIGLKGGVIGGLAALLFFAGAALTVGNVLPSESGAQLAVLFGRFSLGIDGLFAIAVLVPIIAALTALTSRLTVRRFLKQTS